MFNPPPTHTHLLGKSKHQILLLLPKVSHPLPWSPATADLFSDAEGWRAFSGYLPKCKHRCRFHSSFARFPLIHQHYILLRCLRHYYIVREIASSSETVHSVTRYVSHIGCEHWLLYNALFWDIHETVQLGSSLGFRRKGGCLSLGWGINSYYLFFSCGLHFKDLRETSSDLGVKHAHFFPLLQQSRMLTFCAEC